MILDLLQVIQIKFVSIKYSCVQRMYLYLHNSETLLQNC